MLAYKLDKEALPRAIELLEIRGYFDEPRTQNEARSELARHFDAEWVWDEFLRLVLTRMLTPSGGRPCRYSRKPMRKAA